jgi:type II secretory pathway predicted ATPase ExeA
MYLTYYGFSREPFQMAPDPGFLFPSPSHQKALDVIRHGVESRAGLMMVTGREGLGKTTVVRSAVHRLASDGVKPIVVVNPRLAFGELIKLIYGQLGLVYPHGEEQFELLRRLQQALIDDYRRGANVALFIDDAHDMPVDVLENLRLLSDLEVSRDKLIQIVLIGRQPNLERRLEAFELRPLKQRIAYRATLSPLTAQESVDYINQRVDSALEVDFSSPFSKSSVEAIARHCNGIPSRIQIICHGVLATGFALTQRPIAPGVVRRVIADLEGRSRKPWLRWAMAPVALLLVAALIPFFRSTDRDSTKTEAQEAAREAQKTTVAPTPPPITQPVKETAVPTALDGDTRLGRTEPGQDSTGSPKSDSTLPAVTIVHPPKALSPGHSGAGAKIDTASTIPPGGSLPIAEAPENRDAAAQTNAPGRTLPSAQGQAASEARKTAATVSGESAKQSQVRRAESTAPPATAARTTVSQTARPVAPPSTGRDKTRSKQSRPDPSEIIDWFIDKRIKPN